MVAVISDCLQHMLAISGKYQAVDGDILTCKKKLMKKKENKHDIQLLLNIFNWQDK